MSRTRMSAEPTTSTGFAEVNGAQLHYEQRGVGTPILLLHGGLVSGAMWEPLLAHLTDGFRAIAPDSRGHGRSTNPSGTLSYTQLADDVAALSRALDLQRPVLCGYSDGGQVALELAVRHPEIASAIIVGGAHPDFDASGLRETTRRVLGADALGTPDVARFEANLGDSAAVAKSFHAGGDEQWRRLLSQTGPMWLDYPGLTPEDLRRMEAPLLLFVGDRDELLPPEHVLALYRGIAHAELAVIPGADHGGVMSAGRAGLLARLIRDFVERRREGA